MKIVTEVESKKAIYNEDHNMPNSADEVKTNIRVDSIKYELLKDIKRETGIAINALIAEGIDLILIKYEDELNQSVNNAAKKAKTVKSVISKIKLDKQ